MSGWLPGRRLHGRYRLLKDAVRRRRPGVKNGIVPAGCQRGKQFRHPLIPLVRLQRQAAFQHAPLRRRKDAGEIGAEGIAFHPVHRLLRRFAGEHIVQRGAVGVHVAPGPDPAGGGVHLDRGKAPLYHRVFRGAAAGGHHLYRAEIQQLGLAVGVDHDVVGADVPVDEPAAVDLLQRLAHGRQQLHGLGKGHPGGQLFQEGLQRDALHELHDDVGGVVLLKVVQHPHDAGNVVQHRQRLRFVHALVDPRAVAFPDAFGRIAADDRGLRGIAPHRPLGEIFLDRHPAVQVGIEPCVGDAEAALSQRFADHVPVPQQGTRRQMVGLRHVSAVVEPASRTDRITVQLRKTIDAVRVLHLILLLIP